MRRASLTLLACAGLAAGAGPSTAAAADATAAHARTVRICAARAALYASPGGARVAIVHHGDRVKVLAVGADDPWWRVAAAFGTRGWVRESAVCEKDR